MTSLNKLSLFAALLLATSASASSITGADYRFAGDVQFAGFCEAALTDDVTLLKRAVSRQVGSVADSRKSVMRKLLSEDGVTCNGHNLEAFSRQVDAMHVLDYLTQHK